MSDVSKLDINNIIYNIKDEEARNELLNKANINQLPTKVSDLTNDSNFIDKSVNDLTYYTTTTDLTSLLSNKANIEDIPTKTSQLSNDNNFIDKSVNDLTYYTTTTDLTSLLSNKANISDLNQLLLKSNDTLSFTDKYFVGVISGSKKQLLFTVPYGKVNISSNTPIINTLIGGIRGNGEYILNNSTNIKSDYKITIQVSDSSGITFRIEKNDSTAFSGNTLNNSTISLHIESMIINF